MTSFDLFLTMSEELCCIPVFFLKGTGFDSVYYQKTVKVVGQALMDRILAAYAALPVCCQEHREAAVLATLLQDAEFGDVVRNIIKFWYLSTWLELPKAWTARYPVFGENKDSIPDPYAYAESLLGPAVGAHPAGAKPSGHQSWVHPPAPLPFAAEVAPRQCKRTVAP